MLSTPQPLSWQQEPIRVLTAALRSGQSALDASDTGTGKTWVACFAAKAAGKKLAVVCPKSVVPAWKEVAAAVGNEIAFVKNVESLKSNGLGVLTFDARGWQWSLPANTLLVFDEVHRFSASDSSNAKILAAAPRPVLMLSATAAGDPTKMRAIGHQLGLTSWRDWWQWCGRNGCKKGYFGGIEFKGTPEQLTTLHKQIFNTGRGVRVRISDLGSQFPDNRIDAVSVPVEDQKAIDAAYLEELKQLEAGAQSGITESLRSQQISEHEKLAATIELAQDKVASGCSVVIFVHFRDSLERLQTAFPGCAVVHGDQTEEERADLVRLFQADETHVMVAMIQAGGLGLSLHDLNGNRPRVSLIFPGWSAVELRQALGRIHRAGGRSPAQQHLIFAAGTIEERIRNKVQTKLDRIDLLNDGDLSIQDPKPKPQDPMLNATIPRPTESQGLLPQVLVPNPRGNGKVPAVQHSEREHAKVSPSKLKAKEICPVCEDDPERPDHPDTLQGTVCHEACDSGDDSKLTTDEQRAWVKLCRDYVAGYAEEFPIQFREEKLDIIEDVWGYADLILLNREQTQAKLIDFKFGSLAQEDVQTNPAAQAYVLGIFKRWRTVTRVDAEYLYPRREEISQHSWVRAEMPGVELRIKTILARVKAGTERNPAPEVCLYCRHTATCPALHAAYLPIAKRYADDHKLPLPAVGDFTLVKDPQTWSRLLAAAPVLEQMADSIKRHALEFRQQAGIEIPGYELRTRQGRKVINNAVLAWEVAQQFGLTQQQFLSSVEVSAKKLADAAGENAPRGQKTKKGVELEGKLRDAGTLTVGNEVFYLAKSK